MAKSLRSQLEELLQAGTPKAEILRSLKLNHTQFHKLMAKVDPMLRSTWRGRRHVASTPVKYTNEAVIAALQSAARLAKGNLLSINTYKRLRQDHPEWPSHTFLTLAKDWNKWLELAGLPVTAALSSRQTYSDADICAALNRVSRLCEGPFTAKTYDRLRRPDDPLSHSLRKRTRLRYWNDILRHYVPHIL